MGGWKSAGVIVAALAVTAARAAPLDDAAAGNASPPVAAAAKVTEDGDSAKLSFDVSAAVAGRAREIPQPDRVVLDLPEVDFRLPPNRGHALAEKPDAIIKAFRFGLFGPGKSRVVVDLARPACVARVDTRRLVRNGDAARLTLELKACSAEAFAAAAADHAPPPVAAAPQAAPAPSDSNLPVVVLDPGHGGVDGGAFGLDGAVEKTLVFAFAEVLRAKLTASGRYRVIMTRDGDQYVSLEDRVLKARSANAALFVSIHADTLKDAAGVSGTTVYTCSERASDLQAQRIAEHENDADREAGDERRTVDPGVADILRDLERRETRTNAHRFSHGLVARLSDAGGLNRNPERSAGFVVLKAPDFPSVLVELGFISNARDVANLKSDAWREKTADAMRAAIDNFFAKPGAEPSSIAVTGAGQNTKTSP